MFVDLPATGCNVIQSSTSFYNYSPDRYTRSLYYIYDGNIYLANTTTAVRPYDVSGTCLVTGDLVYKPELDVYFPILAFGIVAFCFILVYLTVFKRFLK